MASPPTPTGPTAPEGDGVIDWTRISTQAPDETDETAAASAPAAEGPLPPTQTRQAAEPAPRQLTWTPGLDGLRAVAVLLVMLSHTELAFLFSWMVATRGNGYLQGGVLGVDLFFVLSGFLITALLLGGSTASGGRPKQAASFYARRALRLLPALFVFLLVGLAYDLSVHTPRATIIGTYVAALLYYSNWYRAAGEPVSASMGHLWTLSIEEQFYLVWPAILLVALGFRRRLLVVGLVMVAAIVAVMVNRAVLWNGTAQVVELSSRTDTRADALLVGALVAQLWSRRRTPTRGLAPAAWVAAVFLVLCVAFARVSRDALVRPTSGFLYLGGFTLIAIAMGVIILAVVEGAWGASGPLTWRPLRAVGRVSYGLYLWHLLVFVAVVHYLSSWPAVPQILVAWTLSFACTLASWWLIEKPFLRLKSRFEPAR